MSETVNVVIAGTPTPIILYDSNTEEAARQVALAAAQVVLAEQAVEDATEVVAEIEFLLRDSINLYEKRDDEALPFGAVFPANYNAGGSTGTTLPTWGTSGFTLLSGGTSYVIEIAGYVDPEWGIRDRAHFYNSPAGAFNSISGPATAVVRSYEFTTPVGGDIFAAFNFQYVTGTPDAGDFAALLEGVSIRLASAPAEFEPITRYITPGAFGISDDLSGDIIAQRVGNYTYLRIPNWGDGLDSIQRWLEGHVGAFNDIGNPAAGNGCIDFVGEKTISSAWPKGTPLDVLYNSATSTPIRSGGDECIPIFLANATGMPLGGGHGFIVRNTNLSAPHGLTFANIGKRYTSASALEYVLAFIVDADSAMFIPKPTGALGEWIYSNGAISGATLTPVGGGAALTVASEVSGQLYPIVQSYSSSVAFSDGRELGDGLPIMSGQKVIFSETYGIPNFIEIYDELVALEGTFTANPDYGSLSVTTQLEMNVSWSVDWTGFAEILVAPYFYQQTLVAKLHGGQLIKPVITGSETITAIVPGSLTLNGRDFAAGSDITANATQHDFVRAVWANAAKPVSAIIQLTKDGGVPTHGVASVLSRALGIGVPAVHDTYISVSGFSLFMAATEKSYMVGANGETVPANALLEMTTWNGSVNPAKFGPADFVVTTPQAGKHAALIYKVSAANKQWIPMDRRLVNMPVALARQTNSGALLSSIVTPKGILVDFGNKSEVEVVIG